ncbi:MAG: hypothetical protein ACW963_05785, partial [Candidatus Sifarchaeia archaeon]
MLDLASVVYHRTDTWPTADDLEKQTNDVIADFISKIYRKGVFCEINKLMTCDQYKNCAGIGHIVLIAITCAIDSLSAFASGGGRVGDRFTGFIAKYFPNKYSGKENSIYKAFRCDSVHGWNLHRSTISGKPNDQAHLSESNGVIYISL